MAKKKEAPRTGDYLNRVDFLFNVYREKLPDNGEDAFVYSANVGSALVGVFDGCGGAGAKRYPKLQNKTGAYTASRIASGAVMEWFSGLPDSGATDVAAFLRQRLEECHQLVGEESRLVSPLVRTFPTTAAFAVCRETEGQDRVDFFWAGDSRVYLLDEDGLAQLSTDDLSVPDAMENLYNDGVLTNVVSLSKPFTLHHGAVLLEKPGMVFAATDGCFGYVSTPMEFEGMLLSTLADARSVRDWEALLTERIGTVAGDDYTLSGVALGFGSFEQLRAALAGRLRILEETYLAGLSSLTREEKTCLWNLYRKDYSRCQAPLQEPR